MNQTVFEVFSALPPRLDTPYLFAEEDGKPSSVGLLAEPALMQ